MQYETVHILTTEQIKALHALYQNEWWTQGRTLLDVEEMLRNTDYVFGLLERSGERLIGFARVLTDRVFKALVLDVIVHPDFRNRGLGRALMELIRTHPELQNVKHFELYCLPELVPFYEAWGFTADLNTLKFMRSDNFVEPARGDYRGPSDGPADAHVQC